MTAPDEFLPIPRATAFERIAQARQGIIERLIDRLDVDLERIEILRSPRAVRLMMRLTEGITQRPFNLGEVLASEAEVMIDDQRAYMMVVGDAPERAFLAAVLLALYRRFPEMRDVIDHDIDCEEAVRRADHQTLWNVIASSRVEFEGGAVEAYSAADRTKGRGS
jgi:phosphonate C-P lyase system protein PhnG